MRPHLTGLVKSKRRRKTSEKERKGLVQSSSPTIVQKRERHTKNEDPLAWGGEGEGEGEGSK